MFRLTLIFVFKRYHEKSANILKKMKSEAQYYVVKMHS